MWYRRRSRAESGAKRNREPEFQDIVLYIVFITDLEVQMRTAGTAGISGITDQIAFLADVGANQSYFRLRHQRLHANVRIGNPHPLERIVVAVD